MESRLNPLLSVYSWCARRVLTSQLSGKIIPGCDVKEHCWNCSKAVNCTDQFFCNACHRIQPPGTHNLFDYLGIPTNFDVKNEQLKKRFRDLQAKLHPDKFASASAKEKEFSDEHSRILNDAMTTLSEPLQRAKYLLDTLGGEGVQEHDMDPDVLMEILEWQEAVSNMSEEEKLRQEKEKVQVKIDEILVLLGGHFESKNLDEVKKCIIQLSYLYSIRNAINVRIEKSFAN